MTPHFVARQLAHPQGLRGRVIAFLMNRTNARLNACAVRQLEPMPSERVLEIGFGGGVALPPLIERAGYFCGVDRSADMVQRATRRFRKAVDAGHCSFVQGSIEALPCPDASFQKVCTVNTLYFWTSLAAGCAELHRVLAPGGRLVIGFMPKARMDRLNMPAHIFTARASGDVDAALKTAGFKDLRVTRPAPDSAFDVVVATR